MPGLQETNHTDALYLSLTARAVTFTSHHIFDTYREQQPSHSDLLPPRSYVTGPTTTSQPVHSVLPTSDFTRSTITSQPAHYFSPTSDVTRATTTTSRNTSAGHKWGSMDDSGYQPTDFELPNIKQSKSRMSSGDGTSVMAATSYRSTAGNTALRATQPSWDWSQRVKRRDSGDVSSSSREWSPRMENPAYSSELTNNILTSDHHRISEEQFEQLPNEQFAIEFETRPKAITSESNLNNKYWSYVVTNSNHVESSVNRAPDESSLKQQQQIPNRQQSQKQQQRHHTSRLRRNEENKTSQTANIHWTSVTNLSKTHSGKNTTDYRRDTPTGLLKQTKSRMTLSVLDLPKNTSNNSSVSPSGARGVQQRLLQKQPRGGAAIAGKQTTAAFGKSQPMTKSVSQPNLLPGLLVARSEAFHLGEGDADEEQATKKERVVSWLLDIRRHNVERPVSPDIEDEGPLQTDTALHVVYGGDQ